MVGKHSSPAVLRHQCAEPEQSEPQGVLTTCLLSLLQVWQLSITSQCSSCAYPAGPSERDLRSIPLQVLRRASMIGEES